MANIATTKELIVLCREAGVTLYLWGVHGIGKSSIVRQVAEKLGIGFVDMRCAQLEPADLRGFPDKGSDGRTHFLPPGEMPHSGAGILLLDEINRANQDVLSAAFQLVLDRAVGEYQLPAQWSIVCAGNFQQTGYAVTELDPAFRDRFCHAVVSAGQTTYDEWAEWIAAKHGPSAQEVIEFCGLNLSHLEADDDEDLGFPVLPSRRSWEMAIRCLATWEKGEYSRQARQEALAGLVGRELAVAFIKHRPSIMPARLIEDGVEKSINKLRDLSRNQLASLMRGLVSFTVDRVDDDRVAEVVLDFAEFLVTRDKDLALAYCTSLMSRHKPTIGDGPVEQAALLANPKLAVSAVRLSRKKRPSKDLVTRLADRPRLARTLSTIASHVAVEPA